MEVQGCDFYTFRNGKVIRKDSYWKIVESERHRDIAQGARVIFKLV